MKHTETDAQRGPSSDRRALARYIKDKLKSRDTYLVAALVGNPDNLGKAS